MQHEGDNVLAYARYVLANDVLAKSDLPRESGVYFESTARSELVARRCVHAERRRSLGPLVRGLFATHGRAAEQRRRWRGAPARRHVVSPSPQS